MDLQLEKLSGDIIDEDFVNLFYGLHLLQGIIGRLSVQIKYGFATAPSQWYFFYSIAFVSTSILLLTGFIIQCETVNNSILVDAYFKTGAVLNMCFVLKTFVRDIIGNSSELYVKLHKIDKDLGFKDGKQCNKNLAKYVTCFSIGLVIYSLALVTMFNIHCLKRFCPFALVVLLPEMVSCLDMVMLSFIIYYVSIRVGYINKILNTIKSKPRNEIKSCERLLLDDGSCSLDVMQWNHLLMGMKTILTIIENFLDLNQYQVFSFTCQWLIWVMLAIQSSIFKVKNHFPVDNITVSAVFASSMVISMAILFALCMTADVLSNKLEKSRKICVDIRHTFDESMSRRNAKRMLLLLETKYDLSIYDIYTLGSHLPIKLLAIIATYTIVLLQYALG